MSEMISNVCVYGLEESIRGAKFPMSTDVNKLNSDITPGILNLAQSENGAGHDNFLNGIIVQFDLAFTNKAWVEMERYHFMDFISSQSTMHRICRFDLDNAYNEYVDPEIIKIMKNKVAAYNEMSKTYDYFKNNDGTEEVLNKLRDDMKEQYLRVLYSNPSGFIITARMTTNYRQLKTIYKQRKDHRLPEWRAFCKWIETLPHSEFIIGKN